MNKTQLVDALAARIGDRSTAASAVDGLLDIIVDTVSSGGSVSLTGFGVFEARARAPRAARNPRTGETVDVPATTVPAFRPGTGFRSSVGGNGAGGGTGPGRARPTPGVAGATAVQVEEAAPAEPARGTWAAEASGAFSPEKKAPGKKASKKASEKAVRKTSEKVAGKKKAKAKK